MSIDWLLTNLIATLLLPPVSLLLMCALGWWLLSRHPRLGRALLGAALAALWLLSTPIVAGRLLDGLKPPHTVLDGSEADAIVILGGGRIRDSLDYNGDTLGVLTLERVRYGARLARMLDKPVLVTGGMPDGGSRGEGELMRAALETEFSTPVRWVEQHANNTRENARLAAAQLHHDGVARIYLVSHAWHLARAVPEFEATGLKVTPAGFGYHAGARPALLDFLPQAKALQDSYYACHEWLGLLWYRLRN